MEDMLENLNEGYEWVIDLDIEKYFETVNHDKLISCVREQVNEKRGPASDAKISQSRDHGKRDRAEKRDRNTTGLRFVRYADGCDIFVKSEMLPIG